MNPQRPLAAELWTENCLKSVVSKNKRLLLLNEGLNQKSARTFYGSIPRGTSWNFSRNRSGVWKNWLSAYKTSISLMDEDRAKVTMNCLHKVVHGLSIADKMRDLEWPLSEIQGHWYCKWEKFAESNIPLCWTLHCELTNSPTGLCVNISETVRDTSKVTIND